MIDDVAVLPSFVIIGGSLIYSVFMFFLSIRPKILPNTTNKTRLYVFLLACLNEDRVLDASLRRILELAYPNTVVLVIDDASDDDTAEIARTADPQRIRLFQRFLPDARKGKGAALNAALDYLEGTGLIWGYNPEDVIVCVVDADGRLDQDVVAAVDQHFADRDTGAVQIGVRMYNRTHGILARLQDMEFVIYTEIFQKARRHVGSVGMGGNGQFMRLSALRSLGEKAWSDSLTEDLDLGIRLTARGWRNEYCSTAAVSQQAVLTMGRLVRQRSRWFQGHLQSATKLIPRVLRSIPAVPATDLVYHLSSPFLLLLTSLLPVSFLIGTGALLAASVHAGHLLISPWWLPAFYLLTFGMAPVYAWVYTRREPGLGVVRALALGHVYVLYGYIWFAAGWRAFYRMIRGQHTWLKTART